MGNENLFFKLENVICIFIQDKVKSSWCLNICLICLFAHQGSSNYVSFIMKLRIARPYGIFMKEKYPCLSLKVFLNTPMPTWFLMSQAFGRPIFGEDRNILCIINICFVCKKSALFLLVDIFTYMVTHLWLYLISAQREEIQKIANGQEVVQARKIPSLQNKKKNDTP